MATNANIEKLTASPREPFLSSSGPVSPATLRTKKVSRGVAETQREKSGRRVIAAVPKSFRKCLLHLLTKNLRALRNFVSLVIQMKHG